MPRDALHTGRDGINQEDDNDTSVCTPAVHREGHGTGTGDNEQNNTTRCVYSRTNNVQSIMGHRCDCKCEQLLVSTNNQDDTVDTRTWYHQLAAVQCPGTTCNAVDTQCLRLDTNTTCIAYTPLSTHPHLSCQFHLRFQHHYEHGCVVHSHADSTQNCHR